MDDYRIKLTCRTTEGTDFVTTDPMFGLGETMDHLAGMIAAVGEDNVIRIEIERV